MRQYDGVAAPTHQLLRGRLTHHRRCRSCNASSCSLPLPPPTWLPLPRTQHRNSPTLPEAFSSSRSIALHVPAILPSRAPPRIELIHRAAPTLTHDSTPSRGRSLAAVFHPKQARSTHAFHLRRVHRCAAEYSSTIECAVSTRLSQITSLLPSGRGPLALSKPNDQRAATPQQRKREREREREQKAVSTSPFHQRIGSYHQ